jgi:hypothetical protein
MSTVSSQQDRKSYGNCRNLLTSQISVGCQCSYFLVAVLPTLSGA